MKYILVLCIALFMGCQLVPLGCGCCTDCTGLVCTDTTCTPCACECEICTCPGGKAYE